MHYVSTRDNSLRYTAAEAIKQGLSRDGGLFLPEELPMLSAELMEKMKGMSYQEIGEHYGLTRERVRQILTEEYPVQGRPIKNCIFPGLLCWMVKFK